MAAKRQNNNNNNESRFKKRIGIIKAERNAPIWWQQIDKESFKWPALTSSAAFFCALTLRHRHLNRVANKIFIGNRIIATKETNRFTFV